MLQRIQYTYLEEFFEPTKLFPDVDWLNEAKGDILCSHCLCINRSCFPTPLHAVLKEPPNEDPEEPIQARIETTGITIFRYDILDRMKDYLADFVLGDCYIRGGKKLDNYATCYQPRYITIRGNRHSRYRICSKCGTIISNVRPGPEYILSRELDGAELYQDSVGNIYLTDDVAGNFGFSAWEGVGMVSISIRETPADGQILPGDPMPTSSNL